MISHPFQAVEVMAVLGTTASVAYYLLCLWSAARFLHERQTAERTPSTQFTPPVSILKPIKGTDPEMYKSFRSHCLQDYPEYEIIFGVSDPTDPAAKLAQQLQDEFPQHSIRLKVCEKNLGANLKVSNLAQMLQGAKYECVIVSDSDIRVEMDYLRRVVAPLADPQVGLVTCLYRAIAGPTLGSKLESLGVSTDFAAGVLVARHVEGGIRFGLGATLAFRRRDLQEIGGFESFADYLADDYELGRRIATHGLKVKLSDAVVETFLPLYTLREFFDHQLRWARTIRAARRGGYLGLALTFGLFWSLVALLTASGAVWAWSLLGLTVSLRLIMALAVGRSVLRDPYVLRRLWLLPLRDLAAVMVWLAGFAGQTVSWRGKRFRLREGKLLPGEK